MHLKELLSKIQTERVKLDSFLRQFFKDIFRLAITTGKQDRIIESLQTVELILSGEFSRIQAEQIARAQRKEDLRQTFDGICKLVINTGKQAKAVEALRVVQALTAPKMSFADGSVLQLASTQEEPATRHAADAAQYKAELAKQEYLERLYPELMFMLQRLHGALIDGQQQFLQEILHGVIFLGADTNVFINGTQHHKLKRAYPVLSDFPEAAYAKLRQELYETYVYPKKGRLQVVWDFSSVIINGATHTFTDQVEIVAKPLDRELVDLYLAAALADGKILGSNTHLAAFEMLRMSGRVTSAAMFSHELASMGHRIEDFRQAPKRELLDAIQRSIDTNATVYVS